MVQTNIRVDLQLNVCIQKMCISVDGIVQVQCDHGASNSHGAELFPSNCKTKPNFCKRKLNCERKTKKCTFLQQSLSSRHILSWALISAQGDLSASCSPSSEYDNGIFYAKTNVIKIVYHRMEHSKHFVTNLNVKFVETNEEIDKKEIMKLEFLSQSNDEILLLKKQNRQFSLVTYRNDNTCQ